MTHLLRKNSPIPAYMAYPRFLLSMDISETAKLVYVLLLDRARRSAVRDRQEQDQHPADGTLLPGPSQGGKRAGKEKGNPYKTLIGTT